jgi:release factor glutamine methyltransferase
MKPSLFIQQLAPKLLPAYGDMHVATDNAWWLVETLTETTKTALLAQEHLELSPTQEHQLAQWVHEIVEEHKPIQYVVGTVPFLNLSLRIKPPMLIPRPETEEWVANLIAQLHAQITPPNAILDLCTGSGCIALALAQAFPESAVCAVDIDAGALALAQENADRHEIKNVYGIASNLFAEVPPIQFQLITANPPYIAQEEWKTLDDNVRLWEAQHALVADDDGLGIIKQIIAQAPRFLAPGGQLFIEIGHQQGPIVQDFFLSRGFINVAILQDIQKKDRVVTGTWNE